MKTSRHWRIVAPTFLLLALSTIGAAQSSRSKVWVADNGDGTYRNPVLYADYSDPDVIRVGDDFYLTASSFNSAPGLPILHSKDLVNWTIIGHALKRQVPLAVFKTPQHGNGVWAPAIRYHQGEFFIFYPDPDYGIYLVKARNPAGPWSEPHLVKAAKGWIDPCPFWDDDGQAYLVSAFAKSRAGINGILTISRMSTDGMKLLDEGRTVFAGGAQNPTVEGPKLYKRNGYYYIFAPAGGVEKGWQLALRAKNIFGPYESKIVLAQGQTYVNGPHQGAWIETQTGESWFMHFQDQGLYGRVVHLQPMRWIDDWPIIGADADGDGTGEPVSMFRKPNVGRSYAVISPRETDEFNARSLGLQWQWQANPESDWAFPGARIGSLRLLAVSAPDGAQNLWPVPNLLLQKFPAPSFTVTTKLELRSRQIGDRAGLVVMGLDYSYIAIQRKANGLYLSLSVCKDADKGTAEKKTNPIEMASQFINLRVSVHSGGLCTFSYSTDGRIFKIIGEPFTARQGKWVGAKVGIFALGENLTGNVGYADFDWFRVNR